MTERQNAFLVLLVILLTPFGMGGVALYLSELKGPVLMVTGFVFWGVGVILLYMWCERVSYVEIFNIGDEECDFCHNGQVVEKSQWEKDLSLSQKERIEKADEEYIAPCPQCRWAEYKASKQS